MPVPSSITDLSSAAASNSPAGSDPISNSLDDYLRAIQAILRAESLNKGWERWYQTATYLSATSFSVTGDQTAYYHAGRRLKVTLSGPVTAYCTVLSSSYSSVTTVTVINDSTVLSSPISEVQLGADVSSVLQEFGPSFLFTTAGTAPAFTATTYGSATPVTGQRIRLKLHSAGSGSANTLAINGGSAKSLKMRDGSGSKVDALLINGAVLQFEYDGTDWVCDAIAPRQVQSVTASVNLNALTVGLNPCSLDFHSSTLTTGAPNTRVIHSALSLTVPSGATLGTSSGVAARLAIVAIDNSGTVELAIVNTQGANLDESALITTSAIGAGSNTAGTFYSTTGRTSVPFRVVGYIDITEATAGTWASAPTTLSGAGLKNVSVLSGGIYTATTSGTSVDVTGIPAWAKRVTIVISGLSTNGTSNPLIQLGAGSVDATSYLASGCLGANAATPSVSQYTTGFGIPGNLAANVLHGVVRLTSLQGNIWVADGALALSNGAVFGTVAGSKTLSGSLDRIRFTTVGGTDTFDAGAITVYWE